MDPNSTLGQQVEAQREILKILIRVVTAQAKQIDGLLAASEEMLRGFEATGNITDDIDSEIVAQLTSLANRVMELEAMSKLESSKE